MHTHKQPSIYTAALLEQAARRYKQGFCRRSAIALLVHIVWLGVVAGTMWLVFDRLLPYLNARSANDLVTGLYVLVGAAGLLFVLWLVRRVGLVIAACADGGRFRLGAACTAGLAEILCDLVLYGLIGVVLYHSIGMAGLAGALMRPSAGMLVWVVPCGVMVLFWLTVKQLVIPIALRERRHFFSAVARSLRLGCTKRLFPKLLCMQAFLITFALIALGAGYAVTSNVFGVPAFFASIPYSQYLAPLWHVGIAYVLTIPLSPFYSLMHEACADAAAGDCPAPVGKVGFGARAAAFVLDAGIVGVVLGGLLLAVLLPMTGGKMGALFTGAAAVVLLLALLLCVCLVCAVMEALCKGQTIGKRIMRLRVISADKKALTFGQAYMRGLLRVVDLFLIGEALMLFGENKTRLGDKIAKTRVEYRIK